MNDTLLLFSTGQGYDSGWLSTHARSYPASTLRNMKPYGNNKLNLFFVKDDFEDVVELSIENGKHIEVMTSIWNKITNTDISTAVIADVDEQDFASKYISGVVLNNNPFLYYNNITDSTAVNTIPINTKVKKLISMNLCNVHSSSATVQVYLSNASDTVYIIKDTVITTGSTLKLSEDELEYDGDVFNLYVKIAASTPIDVIIR